MGLVLAWALALAGLRALSDSYRREWQAEQETIKAIRAEGNVEVGLTINVGPQWVRRLVGPGRQSDFDRVRALVQLGPGSSRPSYLARLAHLQEVIEIEASSIAIHGPSPEQAVMAGSAR